MDCVFWVGFSGDIFAVKKIWSNVMKKINNRGELTTQQLITIIILIISFAVLMIFIFRLNLRGEATNKEICHNSVLLKEKTGGSLDCRTNYICMSGGGKCEDFNSNQEIVKINMNPKLKEGEDKEQNIKNQIMKAIADEMADCWWMFGEGQVDYASFELTEKGRTLPYQCAICSSVKFDLVLQNTFEKQTFTYNYLYDYLDLNEKSNSQTYLKYLYGVSDKSKAIELAKKDKVDIEKENLNLKERYSVITGSVYMPLNKDTQIHSYLIKSDEISDKTKCGVFGLTKA